MHLGYIWESNLTGTQDSNTTLKLNFNFGQLEFFIASEVSELEVLDNQRIAGQSDNEI